MKLRGFTLEEMKEILKTHSLSKIEENLDNKIKYLENEISQLKKKMQLVTNSRNLILSAIPTLKDDFGYSTKKYTVSMMPKTVGIFTRYRSRIYAKEVFWDRFADIYRICDEDNSVPCGPFTATFHEHYTHQFFFEEGDLEILLPIQDGDLSKPYIKEIGGFLRVSCYFVGHYSQLLPEYVDLIKWIEENDYEITGYPMEEYLVEFTHGVSAEKYITRIGFPVKKKKSNE